MTFIFYLYIGLLYLNLCPTQNVEGAIYKFLGILSKNREEWGVSDLACMRTTITIAPFYESLGADAIAFILNQTELSTLCCEAKNLDMITGLKKAAKIEHLRNIISFDEIPEEKAKQA